MERGRKERRREEGRVGGLEVGREDLFIEHTQLARHCFWLLHMCIPLNL